MDAVIVDLERRGKAFRQLGYDTEINHHTLGHLRELRQARASAQLLCRVGGPVESRTAIEQCIDAGATELIVPMIDCVGQAERMVRLTDSRCALTLMVETPDALDVIGELGQLPVKRIYVGLNDLHIARGTRSIFEPLIDGTLDRVRQSLSEPDFGFGGLTLPRQGKPLAARHLYAEMARLDAKFTFIRRSFYRDSEGQCPKQVIAAMSESFRLFTQRVPEAIEHDRQEACRAVAAACGG